MFIMGASIVARVVFVFLLGFTMMSVYHRMKKPTLHYSDSAESQNFWCKGKFISFFADFGGICQDFKTNRLPRLAQFRGIAPYAAFNSSLAITYSSLDDMYQELIDLKTENARQKLYVKIDKLISIRLGTLKREKYEKGNGPYLCQNSMEAFKNALIRITNDYNRKLALSGSDIALITPFYLNETGHYKFSTYVYDHMIEYVHENGDLKSVVGKRNVKSNDIPLLLLREGGAKVVSHSNDSAEYLLYAVCIGYGVTRAGRGDDLRAMCVGDIKLHISPKDGKRAWAVKTVKGKKNNKAGIHKKGDDSITVYIWEDPVDLICGWCIFTSIENYRDSLPVGWLDKDTNPFWLKPLKSPKVMCFFCLFFFSIFFCFVFLNDKKKKKMFFYFV